MAAAGSALLFALAFPPIPLVFPAFVCLVPVSIALVRLADGKGRGTDAIRIGFWFGLLGYACTLYWIAIALLIYSKLAVLGYIGALAWLTPIVALWAASLFTVRRLTRLPLAILLPVTWVALEVLLNYTSDLAFPWLPLGLSTAHTPVLAQIADITGVRGISFWIAACNGLIADAWLFRRSKRAVALRAGAAALLAVLVAVYGVWRMKTTELHDVAPIAVVQPNIPQEDKWQEENRGRIVGILAGLTREHMASSDAQLVIWPEVALPGYMVDHPEWADTLRSLGEAGAAPVLFGVLDAEIHADGSYDYFNAAMLTDNRGRLGGYQPYRKEYLVPVIERVPFLNPDWFSAWRYFGGFGHGENPQPFQLPFGRVGVLICYESVFPQLSREYRRKGADLIVNITNDAWFGRSVAPYQHESHLTLRAIENRLGIVRSANTGFSEYVDPLGRRHGSTELFTAAARTFHAQTTSVQTLYVRFGDWLGTLAAAATIAALSIAWWLRWRRRGRP
jgi:apolipoprotein N-acyltransferase